MAAELNGELRGDAPLLHKKNRIRVKMMRLDKGKRKENTGGTGRLACAGMESKTAAEKRSSGVEFREPGGTIEVRRLGETERRTRGFIGEARSAV